MGNRRWGRITARMLLLLLLVLIINGCGLGEVPGEPEEPMPEEKEYSVVLYFAHIPYIETGNEDLPKMVEVRDFSLEAQEGRQYFELIDVALRQVPESLQEATTMIDQTISVHDVVVDGGTAIVDLSGEGLNNGSLAEAYVISQIVESLRESFSEIQQVQFLVDGAKRESLMGHYSSEEPFTEGIFRISQGE